ncbi:MAG: amino acid ABC transporter substrate-binding protein [Aestuariivirga sp.]|uniref:amino acid ABC transporter substrate-binding protein n=1 Tax=Aestuariivirga sp. TaxID=2650926 RepID=UPI0038D023E6
MKRLLTALAVAAALLPGLAQEGARAATLADVKARGTLNCGVNQGLAGFAARGSDGAWAGFDVDFCRALAAAVLGDAAKVSFVPVGTQDRFDKLASGAIDVLARNTTWTMERETKLPLRFVGVSYHDGQGFIVKKLLGVTSALQMSGAAICFLSGTTTEANVADFFREKDMAYTPVTYASLDELVAGFDAGKCDTYTADVSQLYAVRLRLGNPDDALVLPDVISKEPLGPAVRQGDEQWFTIVRWVLFALINAEELEVTQGNAAALKSDSRNPAVRRLLGAEGSFGPDMGLDADWALRMLSATGNYGEIFARNLGPETPLAINRGLNALWSQGGLLYAPPLR